MRVLVTGAAGFIGAHLCRQLLSEGSEVIAVDRISDYYSPSLKRLRFHALTLDSIPLVEWDMCAWPPPSPIMEGVDHVVHLAAQPGVRLGVNRWSRYIEDNIGSFNGLLRIVTETVPRRVLYASSSSVYGDKAMSPFSESELVLQPNSYYGASKLHNEQTAAIANAQGISHFTGLRFFSAYGPWGRPDMAYWRIAYALRHNEVFFRFGDGSVVRDFTYIDDIIQSVVALLRIGSEQPIPAILNVGGNQARQLSEVVLILENLMGKALNVVERSTDRQDSRLTQADTSLLHSIVGEVPQVPLENGLESFVNWYQEMDFSNLEQGQPFPL